MLGDTQVAQRWPVIIDWLESKSLDRIDCLAGEEEVDFIKEDEIKRKGSI